MGPICTREKAHMFENYDSGHSRGSRSDADNDDREESIGVGGGRSSLPRCFQIDHLACSCSCVVLQGLCSRYLYIRVRCYVSDSERELCHISLSASASPHQINSRDFQEQELGMIS